MLVVAANKEGTLLTSVEVKAITLHSSREEGHNCVSDNALYVVVEESYRAKFLRGSLG